MFQRDRSDDGSMTSTSEDYSEDVTNPFYESDSEYSTVPKTWNFSYSSDTRNVETQTTEDVSDEFYPVSDSSLTSTRMSEIQSVIRESVRCEKCKSDDTCYVANHLYDYLKILHGFYEYHYPSKK